MCSQGPRAGVPAPHQPQHIPVSSCSPPASADLFLGKSRVQHGWQGSSGASLDASTGQLGNVGQALHISGPRPPQRRKDQKSITRQPCGGAQTSPPQLL